MPNDFTVTPPTLKWRVDPPAIDGRRDVPARISTLSTEYVTVLVAAREDGEDINLSNDATVRLAFTAEGDEPSADDWVNGEWDTDDSMTPTRYYARVLVGPDDGQELAAGTYVVWVEVSSDPETVVRPAGNLWVV